MHHIDIPQQFFHSTRPGKILGGGGDVVKLHAHVTGKHGNLGNATMLCIHCTIIVIALA